MQTTGTENINNRFFDGYYKHIWRALIPDGLTNAEVDFLMERASLRKDSKVLDLMCGFGRHSLALGRKGINVTAVDILPAYVDEVNETIEKENLPVSCVEADVIEYQPVDSFDLVICLGNNLSFFDKAESQKLFSMIGSHTRHGGMFIANSWSIAETVFKNFNSKTWSEVNGFRYLVDNKFFFSPARIETNTTFIAPDGTEEVKQGIDYVYSLNEIETMLHDASFSMKEIWSIPGKKKFALGEPRAYIVAVKV